MDDLDLSVRASNLLRKAGCRIVQDLCEMSEAHLWKIRGLGIDSMNSIRNALAKEGLELAPWPRRTTQL